MKLIIGKTNDSRYVFAIYRSSGFVHYEVVPANSYRRNHIRKVAKRLGVDPLPRISWDKLPHGNMIVKKDCEDDARIVASLID